MSGDLRGRLAIPASRLDDLTAVLLDPRTEFVEALLATVAKYGSPEEINRKADAAGRLPRLLEQVRATCPAYLDDLRWLEEERDRGSFVSVAEYRRDILGADADRGRFDEDRAVTLEVSALQYFPWLIAAARRAIEARSLVPGRFIAVRNMKEQEADGDLPAIAAAMEIVGASYVETLDTKGTDGSNVHLGGPATILGYLGGIGEPDEHPIAWVDEFLHYYTSYGVRQVLNTNIGTVLAGFLLHRLGVDIEFKISVFLGTDNPFAALWILSAAKLFARADGSSPLAGLNWSNSTGNTTIEAAAGLRRSLGLERVVRFEHHVTEAWKSIVVQPYDRRDELVALAERVPNLGAKHEGGDPEVELTREHPSDILDYFRTKQDVIDSGDWEAMQQNFLDKVAASDHTARALTARHLAFVAARKLHR